MSSQIFPSVAAAAEHFGIAREKAASRLRNGWTPEQAFGVEPQPRRRREYKSYQEIDGRILPRGSFGDYKLYLITNLVNAKEYVGITLGPLEKRWGEHLSMGPKCVDTKLKRAIRKYGVDKFRVKLLRSDARTYLELMEQEKTEIGRRQTYERGYNSTRGGELVFNARRFRVGDKIFPTLASAAEFYGIDEALIRARLDAMGWSPEEAVGLQARPPNKYAPRGELVVQGLKFPSHKAAAAHFGVEFKKYSLRVTRSAWTTEQALELVPPPPGAEKCRGIAVCVAGRQFPSIASAAKHFGICYSVAAARLRQGWSPDLAFGVEEADLLSGF
ncbi:GIY-YIG nuclease family protein [Caballeronia novacaledonica]|uniref:GIY-YIG domain-containing protein n=1 Tax=Caballeronia novacaledonica TaxID=1544861 RepID=A0AA37I7T9_9BURK|nr:GIY-YIG nuclease family protein [Caballeronia novacaledonica]GJH23814.1 hypothetical protein CBA19CS42_04880 [Caballeronia novacaledonica]